MSKAAEAGGRKLALPSELPILISYLILFVALSFMSPYFLSTKNLLNIGQFSAMMGIAAMGITLVIVSGGIDISIGAIIGMTCVLLAKTIPNSGDAVAFILLGIGIGVACGALNGLIVTVAKVNPLMSPRTLI